MKMTSLTPLLGAVTLSLYVAAQQLDTVPILGPVVDGLTNVLEGRDVGLVGLDDVLGPLTHLFAGEEACHGGAGCTEEEESVASATVVQAPVSSALAPGCTLVVHGGGGGGGGGLFGGGGGGGGGKTSLVCTPVSSSLTSPQSRVVKTRTPTSVKEATTKSTRSSTWQSVSKSTKSRTPTSTLNPLEFVKPSTATPCSEPKTTHKKPKPTLTQSHVFVDTCPTVTVTKKVKVTHTATVTARCGCGCGDNAAATAK